MKKCVIAIAFLTSFAATAQQLPPAQLGSASKAAITDTINFKVIPVDFAYYSKNYRSVFNASTLSRYNPVSGFNDIYLNYRDGLQYSTSKSLLVNLPFSEPYIDTFNPSGSSDMFGALLNGFIGVLNTQHFSKSKIK
ncbi:MAG: hypothetical protein EOO45_07995, partial [Flavobacterium sp.]